MSLCLLFGAVFYGTLLTDILRSFRKPESVNLFAQLFHNSFLMNSVIHASYVTVWKSRLQAEVGETTVLGLAGCLLTQIG